LTIILLPSIGDGRAFNTGFLMFPTQVFNNSCDIGSIDKILVAPPYKDRRLRIMNMIDQGTEILFKTPHEVMSAPYHTNVRGNMESYEFFATSDPAKAEKIARRNKIDLVVMCKNIPTMYLRDEKPKYTPDPKNTQLSPQSDENLALQLVRWSPPYWLRKIDVPKNAGYLIFEVKK